MEREIERKVFEAGWFAKSGTWPGVHGDTLEQAWDRYCGKKPIATGDSVRLTDHCLDSRIDGSDGRRATGVVRQVFDDGILSVEWKNGRRIKMHPSQLLRASAELLEGR